jgi:hypothetical protein
MNCQDAIQTLEFHPVSLFDQTAHNPGQSTFGAQSKCLSPSPSLHPPTSIRNIKLLCVKMKLHQRCGPVLQLLRAKFFSPSISVAACGGVAQERAAPVAVRGPARPAEQQNVCYMYVIDVPLLVSVSKGGLYYIFYKELRDVTRL